MFILAPCGIPVFPWPPSALFPDVQLRGCAEDKTFPGLSSAPPPPDGPISSSSLKIIVTRTAALAVACLTWPPRSPARSHGQVEPAVCGGQGQTLRQRRWEVRHSSVNREVSVINSQRFAREGDCSSSGPSQAFLSLRQTAALSSVPLDLFLLSHVTLQALNYSF